MTLAEHMELIKTTLAAKYPQRQVTRSLKDFADRPAAQLKAGVYTVLSEGEGDYPNYNGLEANYGVHRIAIIGQIQVAETAESVEIENAELSMIEEIKNFTRTLPVTLCSLAMQRFEQSRQLEHPYGWVAVSLEAIW